MLHDGAYDLVGNLMISLISPSDRNPTWYELRLWRATLLRGRETPGTAGGRQ